MASSTASAATCNSLKIISLPKKWHDISSIFASSGSTFFTLSDISFILRRYDSILFMADRNSE